MPDYSKGKIYTIRCHSNDKLIYVGCTIQSLSVRFAGHKRNKDISLYKYISNPEHNTNWDDWYIELYELYSCGSKEELNKREKEVIREIATINRIGYYIDGKDYYEQNKETVLAKKKDRYEQNKGTVLAKAKEYYVQNKETILAKQKDYYEKKKLI
jgi:hypothetical protein